MTEVSWAMIEAACATRSWLLSYDDKSRALVAGIYLAMEAARIPAPAPDEVERLRYALQRIARLTPGRANAATAMDLHHTVAAIAETALSTIPIPQGEK